MAGSIAVSHGSETLIMALHKPEHKTIWYWIKWPFLAVGFAMVFPMCLLIKGYAWTRDGWLRDWEDYIDDPIDFLKEMLHCGKLPFGYQLNISFLMNNRTTTWDIIRKELHTRQYANCDPEDM